MQSLSKKTDQKENKKSNNSSKRKRMRMRFLETDNKSNKKNNNYLATQHISSTVNRSDRKWLFEWYKYI